MFRPVADCTHLVKVPRCSLLFICSNRSPIDRARARISPTVHLMDNAMCSASRRRCGGMPIHSVALVGSGNVLMNCTLVLARAYKNGRSQRGLLQMFSCRENQN